MPSINIKHILAAYALYLFFTWLTNRSVAAPLKSLVS